MTALSRRMIVAIASLLFAPGAAVAEARRITHDGRFKQRPVFSADGALVLFARHEDETIRLFRRDLASGAESRLTDRTAPEFDAVLSTLDRSAIFVGDDTTPNQGNLNIYRLPLDGGEAVQLIGDAAGLSHEESPAVSPDGRRIAFTSTRDGAQELYVAQSDGTELVRLTSDPALDAHPAWSPDGSTIAFATNRWGDLEIALIAPDGSNLRRLTDSPGLDDYPAWSPDGRRLAIASTRSGNMDVWFVDVSDPPESFSKASNVTQNPAWDNFPAWSPAGELGFVSDRDGGYDLYLQPAPPLHPIQ